MLFNADPAKFDEDQLVTMEKRKSKTYLRTPNEKTDTLSLE